MMARSVRRIAVLAVTLALLISVPMIAGAQGTPLKFWSVIDEQRAGYNAEMLLMQDFQAKYSTYSVQRQYLAGTSEIRARWRMAVSAGEIPDVSGYGPGTGALGQLVRDGTVMQLDDVYKARGWDKLFPSSVRWLWRYSDDTGIMGKSGHTYTFGEEADYFGVYINRDLFKKFGLTFPEGGSLKDWEAVCDAFVAKGQPPIVIGVADKWPAASVYWGFLGFYATPDQAHKFFTFGGPDSFFPKDAVVSAARKAQEWVKKGYFQPNCMGATVEDMLNLFKSGKYPLLLAPSYFSGGVNRDVKGAFNWGMSALTGANWVIGATAMTYVIPKGSTQKEAAENFLDMMTNNDVVNALTNNGGVSLFIKDPSEIKITPFRESNQAFRKILQKDMLVPYLDWSNPTAFSVIGSITSDLFGLRITPEAYYDAWKADYDAFRKNQNL